ncbi:hypothetical protein RUE5091_04281 [Ruegeria denitrificans]|uniref:Uncharacterized protein n=1 Tax=Ruegeria denitrificans TaxID=1715692 RepID=A0A0P1IK31_9RHOB|nr:hypothetical protein RUE5091_04281 [Ruegeria denitrificans]
MVMLDLVVHVEVQELKEPVGLKGSRGLQVVGLILGYFNMLHQDECVHDRSVQNAGDHEQPMGSQPAEPNTDGNKTEVNRNIDLRVALLPRRLAFGCDALFVLREFPQGKKDKHSCLMPIQPQPKDFFGPTQKCQRNRGIMHLIVFTFDPRMGVMTGMGIAAMQRV